MNLQFPWNNINDIKFNNTELLNSATMNIHLKQLYDNIYYLNNTLRITQASTTLTGITTLATSAEIATGTIVNKAISTSAFNQVINNINQTTNFSSISSIYITDTIKMVYGEIATPSTSTATYPYNVPTAVTILYNVPFSVGALYFSAYAVPKVFADTNDLKYDFTICSTTDPRLGIVITYSNITIGRMAKICWSVIGI